MDHFDIYKFHTKQENLVSKLYGYLPFFVPLRSLGFVLSEIRDRLGGEFSLDLEELADVDEPVSDSESDAVESEETFHKFK